ncbi:DUF7718 family protein [Streptomyces sp. NPDC055025]
MGSKAERKVYRPPPVPPAEQTDFDISCAEDELLRIRMRTYRNKIVDFAIMLLTREYGAWEEVGRIDCCGGTIHRHLFTSGGEILQDHDPIRDIPDGDGSWDVVHHSYEGALDEMQNNWEDLLRRWRSGK